MATLGIGGVILYESALSFLGIGVPKPYASWGNMVGVVSDKTILVNHLYMWLPPGLCILFTVLAFNFIGDGLRDALDPKMKR
jgi:peptide/nickel transport system permease protein